MARRKTGGAVDRPTTRERKPYGRLTPKQWGELLALYAAGATAKALAVRFRTTERTIYTHANKAGLLRKQRPWMEPCDLDEAALDAAVRAGRGCEAEAPVTGLEDDASLAQAARAAAETAIRMLKDAQPTRAYTYARLAGTLERLARGAAGMAGDGSADTAGMARGRQAALDFLREKLRAGDPSTPRSPAGFGRSPSPSGEGEVSGG